MKASAIRTCLTMASTLLTGSLSLAAQTYEVSGVVMQSMTNAPLAKVTLSLASTNDRGTSLLATESGAEGKFRFGGVPAGKYSLTAQRNGFRTQALDQHGSRSTAVVVGPNSDTSNIVFRMRPRTGLTVMVADEENQPVHQAQVFLFARRLLNGELSVFFADNGSTMDTGRATFSSLDPGTYYAVVNAHPWYARPPMSSVGSLPGLNDEPPRGPLEVAYPVAWYGGGADLSGASPISVELGSRQTVTVTLQPVPAVRVKIPMEDERRQGQYVRVFAELPGGHALFVNPSQQGLPDGMLLTGLAPGRYVFEIRDRFSGQLSKAGPPRNERSSENSQFFVTADVASDMTLPLSASQQVAVIGRIATGLPLPPRNQNIQLVPEASAPGHSTITIPLDENLAFRGTDNMVVPGRYRVATSFPMTQISSIAFNGQPAKPGNMVTLPAGNVALVVTVGQRRVTQVSGVVADADKPRSGVAIYLLPDGVKNQSRPTFEDQSDSDGSFSMEVDAGRYIGVAIENGFDLEYSKPEAIAPYLARGTPIDAAARQSVQVKLELQSRQ
jgi:Carboxypeptidase regulatory-like domain